MCIIIHKPHGVTLSRKIYENCWSHHGDGAGFMVAVDGKLIMKKGFFSLDEMLEAFEPYEKENVILHFRNGTRAGRTKENCHPFMVTEDIGFAHNGTIHKVDCKEPRYNDTWHFNELILKPLVQVYPDIWTHKTVKYLIEEYIGSYNKLAFMNSSGVVKIYNEERGTRDLDCWFSNNDYKSPRSPGGGSMGPHFPIATGGKASPVGVGSANTVTRPVGRRNYRFDNCVACDNCNQLFERSEIKYLYTAAVCSHCLESDPTVKLFDAQFQMV